MGIAPPSTELKKRCEEHKNCLRWHVSELTQAEIDILKADNRIGYGSHNYKVVWLQTGHVELRVVG